MPSRHGTTRSPTDTPSGRSTGSGKTRARIARCASVSGIVVTSSMASLSRENGRCLQWSVPRVHPAAASVDRGEKHVIHRRPAARARLNFLVVNPVTPRRAHSVNAAPVVIFELIAALAARVAGRVGFLKLVPAEANMADP